MTEAELLQEVRLMASERNLLLFHCRDSRSAIGNGFPDLVIAGPKGTFFVELKTNGTSLTVDQRHWGSVLGKGGEKWHIWRPRDLQAGIIGNLLDSIAIYKQLRM